MAGLVHLSFRTNPAVDAIVEQAQKFAQRAGGRALVLEEGGVTRIVIEVPKGHGNAVMGGLKEAIHPVFGDQVKMRRRQK